MIPRQAAIDALPKRGMQKLYNSLKAFLSVQKYSLERGKAKIVFGDATDRVMYKCVGVHLYVFKDSCCRTDRELDSSYSNAFWNVKEV